MHFGRCGAGGLAAPEPSRAAPPKPPTRAGTKRGLGARRHHPPPRPAPQDGATRRPEGGFTPRRPERLSGLGASRGLPRPAAALPSAPREPTQKGGGRHRRPPPRRDPGKPRFPPRFRSCRCSGDLAPVCRPPTPGTALQAEWGGEGSGGVSSPRRERASSATGETRDARGRAARDGSTWRWRPRGLPRSRARRGAAQHYGAA